MKNIKNLYTIHLLFLVLMSVAAVSGFVFMFTNNIDFIIEALNQGKFNLSNVSYCISKVIVGILIPLTFIIPSQTGMGRIRAAKLLFIIYGALHIVTLSWIIPYLFSGAGDMTAFQENTYIASCVLWDTYSLAGAVYSLIFGILSIFVGISVDDNKKKVCYMTLLLPVVRVLLPLITNLITGNGILSVLWITNNYADIIALVAITVAFFIASIHDATWIGLIWNQDYENGTEDEIEF